MAERYVVYVFDYMDWLFDIHLFCNSWIENLGEYADICFIDLIGNFGLNYLTMSGWKYQNKLNLDDILPTSTLV